MSHIIHDFVQGSDQWLAHRRSHFNASEAPAMLGVSPYVLRSTLLKVKATGCDEEISPELQVLFDDGHRFEAIARPWAEEIIGEDLYPICASAQIDGLPLAASYDGATMGEDTTFEHKMLNQDLAESLTRGVIPDHYKPQMEQQLLILGAKRCLFMASNGTRESMRHAWYESDPMVRKALIAGWKQFAEDMKAYQHVEATPATVVAPIEDLPALTVELVGQVKHSNLVAFQTTVMARIQAINTELKTDEDFATADKMVKFLDEGEKRLELVKAQALSQTADIDALFRAIDSLKGEMRAKRLTLDKLVAARKDTIRAEIRNGGIDALAEHVASLNRRLGKVYMPAIPADFAGVMKGKKTIASLRDAVATELARAKIAANEIGDRIEINLKTLAEFPGYAFLFADAAQIVTKANDDFTALVRLRIAEHKAAEATRLEQEREKIRQEETARAQAQAAPAGPAPVITPSEPATPQAVSQGVAKLRVLIAAELHDMSPGELQRALNALRNIKAERQQRRSA